MKFLLLCIVLIPISLFSQTHELMFSKYQGQSESVSSMGQKYIVCGYKGHVSVIDPLNCRNLFGTLPFNLTNRYDESDSSFWIKSRHDSSDMQGGGIDRIDKVKVNGDTLFSFIMPDTMLKTDLIFLDNKPFVLGKRDIYTIELFDVLNKQRIGRYTQKNPDEWEIISSYELSEDMTRLYVKYMYNSISFDTHTGDSTCSYNENKLCSKDRKYFFVRNIADKQFEVYKSTDSSLYYIWKGQKYLSPYMLMKNPEQLFVSGTVFNFLDTLNLPNFEGAVCSSFVEPDNGFIQFRTDYNGKGQMRFEFFDIDRNFVYSSNAELADGAFSADGETFFGIGNYYKDSIETRSGHCKQPTYYYNPMVNVNSNHYSPRVVYATPLFGIPYNINIYNLANDTMIYGPLTVFHNNAFANEGCDTLVYDDTSGRITTIGFGSQPSISSFQSKDALVNMSNDAKLLLCAKGRIANLWENAAYDTLILQPNRVHDASEEVEIRVRPRCTAFSPNSSYLAILDTTRKLHIFSIEKKQLYENIPIPDTAVSALEFTPDGKFLLCGTDYGRVFVMNFPECRPLFSMDDMKDYPVTKIRIASNMKYVAAISDEKALSVWRTNFDLVHASEPQINLHDNLNVSIVPHPASGKFSVNIGNAPAGNVEFRVFDLFGNEMLSANAESNGAACSVESNSSRLPVGTYFYRVLVNGVVIATGSFVVAR